MKKQQYIYFIQESINLTIKIGLSTNPYKRLLDLDTGNAGELWVLLIEKGDKKKEQYLHKRFGDLSIKGEWFSFSEPLICYIEENSLPMRDTRLLENITNEFIEFYAKVLLKQQIRQKGCAYAKSIAREMASEQLLYEAVSKYTESIQEDLWIKSLAKAMLWIHHKQKIVYGRDMTTAESMEHYIW